MINTEEFLIGEKEVLNQWKGLCAVNTKTICIHPSFFVLWIKDHCCFLVTFWYLSLNTQDDGMETWGSYHECTKILLYISTSSLEQNATIQSLRSVVTRELKWLTWLSEHPEDSCERKTDPSLIRGWSTQQYEQKWHILPTNVINNPSFPAAQHKCIFVAQLFPPLSTGTLSVAKHFT